MLDIVSFVPELGNDLVQRDVFSVNQLFLFLPVVGIFLADRLGRVR